MILTIFIIFNLSIKLVTNSNLTVYRGQSYCEANENPIINCDLNNKHLRKHRHILCISGNPDDALIWNKKLIFNTNNPVKVQLLPTYIRHTNEECGMHIDSPFCLSQWYQYDKKWNEVDTYDVPMGPIYDSRWEHFPEYTSNDRYVPITRYINGQQTYKIFSEKGGITFSIRGSPEVNILFCSSMYYSASPCYFLQFQKSYSFDTMDITFNKCLMGFNSEVSCTFLDYYLREDPVINDYEWMTYTFMWDIDQQKFELHDSTNALIKSLTIPYKLDIKPSYIFYQNSRKDVLFRFHNYTYTLATEPAAIIISPPLKIPYSGKLCIDMIVGLCQQCELVVNLVDGSEKRHMLKTIRPSYKYLWWQRERIHSSNITNLPAPISLELMTLVSNTGGNIGNHWAIMNLKECFLEGTVKILTMIVVQEGKASHLFWPTVKCQRLSYSQSRIVDVVDITPAVSTPSSIGDFPNCTNYNIGPYCITPCAYHFHGDCSYVTMCNDNGCFCTQGYNGSDCNEKCSPGSYGYGCTQKCGHCNNDTCNPHSGVCESGCREFQDQLFEPPYCNRAIEIQSNLSIDSVDQLNASSNIIIIHEKNSNCQHYKYWVIPLILILAAISGVLYCQLKKRNKKPHGPVEIEMSEQSAVEEAFRF